MNPSFARARSLRLLVLGTAAAADPGYYVVTVYDDPGVRTVDFRYWTVERPGRPATTWPEVGLGLNINGRWYTELLASWIGASNAATRLSAVEWQNDLLLTRGQYPFDLAVHSLLTRPQNPAAGHDLEFGPVLQTEIGRTQFNTNLVFQRGFKAQADGSTELKYQWQVRYHWSAWLHFGAQGFGELGPWDHWSPRSEQSHCGGPALFGNVQAGTGVVAWQAAYLTGSTYSKHGRMFTARVKYDF